MSTSLSYCCEKMGNAVTGGEIPIVFSRKFREYGIRVLDGGSSFLEIHFCPWCGAALPNSLRDEWFDSLEKLGIDDPFADERLIPTRYLDESWYMDRNK